MKTLKELRQERAALVAAAAKIRGDARANLVAAAAADADHAAITKRDEGFRSQLAANARQVELVDADIVEAELAAEAERTAPAARIGVSEVREASMNDPARGFRSPRDFLMSVMSAERSGGGQRLDPRLRPLATAGSDEHSGASDSYGGFLVPEAFSPELLTVPMEMDPTATLVRQIPMASPTVKINARTDKTHTTSVSGGLTVSRREETVAGTASRLALEQIRLTAHSLFGVAYASEEILTDSPISFAALIASGFQDEFASRLLAEKLLGSGVGEFQGVIGHAGTVDVAKETSQTAATINGTNLVKMRARAWNYSRMIWLANHDTFPSLVSAHVAGTNASAFLFVPGNGTDRPDTLLGRPIYFTEYCPTLGTTGDIVLGCWDQYLLGTLQGVQAAESMHVRFLEHERTYKFWMRNDGQPWWRSALTPRKGANTISPFVTLATRA